MRSLAEAVDGFGPDDTTVKLVRGLLSVLPFLPDWTHPGTLDQMCGSPAVRKVVDRLAAEPGPQSVLGTFDLLDKADRGIALFSGIKGAVDVAKGTGGSLELDPQQAADAGVKAVGLAWVTWKLYGGDPRRLAATPAGQALLAWYAAADIVLPFADNLASGGLDLVSTVIDRYATENVDKLAAITGDESAQALTVLARLKDSLGGLVGQAAAFAQPMSRWLEARLPGFLGAADKVTGVVATGADAFNAYRYLGALVVAQELVARAKVEVAEAESARAAAEARARAEAEEKARKEAEERRARSVVKDDYALDNQTAAASAANAPIKYTRSGGDLAPSSGGPPAKAGCMGCGAGLILLAVFGSAAGVAALHLL